VRLSDFDYHLPEHLIAQHPPEARASSRLLDARSSLLADRLITDFPSLIGQGDLLVFNDTRVLKARLKARRDSGGVAEIMVVRIIDECHVEALLRVSHAPKPESRLVLADGGVLRVVARRGEFYVLEAQSSFYALLERLGSLPLPPYIEHDATSDDEARYQTVYAKHPGAVAAPTAGLHFDQNLLARIDAAGAIRSTLTLHVGAGTFLPVRHEDLSQHVMHEETYDIPAELAQALERTRAAGGRVIAIGTTSLRALESAVDENGRIEPKRSTTQLFITPGYRFKVVDVLLTNFHLPKSTLLMLVSAFAGPAFIRRAYAHAIEQQYRFFSYGDAMLLKRA
jgi:S-adenosylmethionine:tRNA ribosyltransferase-isomerase